MRSFVTGSPRSMLFTVPTTPTMVNAGLVGSPRRICWPIGSRSAKYRSTRYSSMTTTAEVSAVSVSVKTRPATSGICMARK